MKLFGDFFPRYKSTNSIKAIEDYYRISRKYNLSLTQMSLAFINTRTFVTSNIIGATDMEQLKENIGCSKVKLDNEIIKEINSIHKNNPNPAP